MGPVHQDTRREMDARFSPDGKTVAFRRGWDLYTVDVASKKETRLTARRQRDPAQRRARLGLPRRTLPGHRLSGGRPIPVPSPISSSIPAASRSIPTKIAPPARISSNPSAIPRPAKTMPPSAWAWSPLRAAPRAGTMSGDTRDDLSDRSRRLDARRARLYVLRFNRVQNH